MSAETCELAGLGRDRSAARLAAAARPRMLPCSLHVQSTLRLSAASDTLVWSSQHQMQAAPALCVSHTHLGRCLPASLRGGGKGRRHVHTYAALAFVPLGQCHWSVAKSTNQPPGLALACCCWAGGAKSCGASIALARTGCRPTHPATPGLLSVEYTTGTVLR